MSRRAAVLFLAFLAAGCAGPAAEPGAHVRGGFADAPPAQIGPGSAGFGGFQGARGPGR